MSKVRINAFSLSIDGYGAGPGQDLENPLGRGGLDLHQWVFPTRSFQATHGTGETGTTGIDDDFATRAMAGLGAWILGRNMFAPSRGPWADPEWKGWWGPNPPYHCPVFVLTHYARAPIRMDGGTEFRFVTGGIHAALKEARAAAGNLDVRLGGGVSTLRQYLEARLVDEMHFAVAPVVLGSGEHLFQGLDLVKLGYRVTEHVTTPGATHIILARAS